MVQPRWYTRHVVDNRFRTRFSSIGIGAKVVIYYLIIFTITFTLSTAFYRRAHREILDRRLTSVTLQSLSASAGAFFSFIEKVNSISKIVMFDEHVKEILSTPVDRVDFRLRRDVNAFLQRIVDPTDFLSSIYIFDNSGRVYSVEKYGMTMPSTPVLADAPWYDDLLALQGGFLLLNAGGGVFQWDRENPVISFVRVINDVETQQRIGFLVMNAVTSSLTGFERSGSVILDNAGEPVVGTTGVDSRIGKDESIVVADTDTEERSVTRISVETGERYIIASMALADTGWRVAVIHPDSLLADESATFASAAIIVIAINSVLLLAGGIVASYQVTGPIKRLADAMAAVGEGRFHLVVVRESNDEIGMLQDRFNRMVEEIRSLLDRTVEEQKRIRKAELTALQAQIRPHFLYNSFDAVSSLAVSGRTDDVYRLMKALGGFYRTSLSNGNDVVTVKQEIELVRHYVTIQRFRYGDLFSTRYEVEDAVTPLPMLKLTLQPLVENALYHGIKPKGMSGTITIEAWSDYLEREGRLVVRVSDDGVGTDRPIDPQRVDSPGFGLRATYERLVLFYGPRVELTFESAHDRGTSVTVVLPIARGKESTRANIST